jgi:hypothetical protein
MALQKLKILDAWLNRWPNLLPTAYGSRIACVNGLQYVRAYHVCAWWWKQIQFPKLRKNYWKVIVFFFSPCWPWKRLSSVIFCPAFVETINLPTFRRNLLSPKCLYTSTSLHGITFQKCNDKLLLLTYEHWRCYWGSAVWARPCNYTYFYCWFFSIATRYIHKKKIAKPQVERESSLRT